MIAPNFPRLVLRLAVGAFLLVSAGRAMAGGTAAEPAKIRVTTGIPPLTWMVAALGGERVEVTSFVGENQDPHTYSPSPRQIANLKSCDLFLTAGMPFEDVVAAKVSAMHPKLLIVNLGELFAKEHGHGAHDHRHDHGTCSPGNPHIWLSARNLRVMADKTAAALISLDGTHEAFFKANLETLQGSLADLDRELTARLAPRQGATFYAYHPAFASFAEDYGLTQKAVEQDGKSPTPKQLLELVEQARRDGVKTIIVEPQFPKRPGQIIAERINGTVAEINPLGANPPAVLRQLADAVTAD